MLDFKKAFKLETLEIDVAKKIFKLNGEDIGKDCSRLSLHYDYDNYMITVDLDTEVHYFSGKPNCDEVEHFINQRIAPLPKQPSYCRGGQNCGRDKKGVWHCECITESKTKR